MTVMEVIIELLSKTKAGLKYKEIEQKFREEYGRKIDGKDIYVYLGRLKEKGIVKNVVLNRNKLCTLILENLRKDSSEDLRFLISLFERGAVKVYRNKLSKSEFNKLEAL
ncbi:MAG: hypothetical protein ACFFAU_15155 [Candidatus Hodarchaeota archaeon]